MTEAENPAEDFFGRERLLDTLAAATAADPAPKALVEAMFAAVQRFADGCPAADDVTALALRDEPAAVPDSK